jgi:hypothetical protein
VTAYELRRRGYEVEATPSPVPVGRSLDVILPRWVDQDGNQRSMKITGYNSSEIDKDVISWGPGSRGWVLIGWEDGGAHIFAVENVNGKPVYLEPQHPMPGSGTAESHFNRVKKGLGNIQYVRVDDLVPTSAIIDPDDPLVRSVSSGKAEREKIAARLAKSEKARKARQERLKAITPSGREMIEALRPLQDEYKGRPDRYPSSAFAQGVFNAVDMTQKQRAVAAANLTLPQKVAYQTGVNWYQTWLSQR